jgi:pyruvate kinase
MHRDPIRKVKIIATVGPASNTPEMLRKLMVAGVNVFRLNFSHGDHATHKQAYEDIRALEKVLGYTIGILADLQGPKLRIGTFSNKSITLVGGQSFTLDQDPTPGDEQRVCLPHPELFQALEVGHFVLLSDGKFKLKITSISPQIINTEVIVGGELSGHQGLNVPYTHLPIPALTDKDKEDALFAQSLGVDFLAMSFVQSPKDIEELRTLTNGHLPIIAKIEKPRAIEQLEEIIKAADSLMVARGDLGVEISLEELPALQKKIIRLANRYGKPVAVATQMLESMIHAPVPTRAEASDVATAVYDGADAVMLSAESATGEYPLETVAMMDKILICAEMDELYPSFLQAIEFNHPPSNEDAITVAARDIIQQLKAKALINFSAVGTTVLSAANKRPLVPIVGIVPNETIARRLTMAWGVYPIVMETSLTFKEMAAKVCLMLKDMEFAESGDKIVVTGSIPLGQPGSTNLLSIETIP